MPTQTYLQLAAEGVVVQIQMVLLVDLAVEKDYILHLEHNQTAD
jgi:hypothetical protein